MIIEIGCLVIKVYIALQEKRTGVCSKQADNDDKHCLLWDFDNTLLPIIEKSLKRVQLIYSLPTIYVVQSSLKGYHAYCFCARPFREVIKILADTPEIDIAYLRIGVVRGYFTLRITPRRGELPFRFIENLLSFYPEEMSKTGMTVNEYMTSNKGGHNE